MKLSPAEFVIACCVGAILMVSGAALDRIGGGAAGLMLGLLLIEVYARLKKSKPQERLSIFSSRADQSTQTTPQQPK